MAAKTPNLNLILPANGEYFNIWDQPMNNNWTIVDAAVGSLQAEILAARGSATNLDDRLSAGLNPDGTPIASAEVSSARSSSIYGSLNGAVPYTLNDRLEQGDRENFTARSSLPTLVDALAWGEDTNKNNSVISAANNYLTFTGAVVSLAGNVTPLIANINGYRQVVRTIKTATISGAPNTYYLTLTRSVGGEQYLNVTGNTGALGTYATNGLVARLSDSFQNFVTAGVKPGDVLNITAPSGNPNINQYIVLATNVEDSVNLATNELAVIGQFVSAGTGFNYTINNPVAPQLGFSSTPHAKSFARSANKIYIGRCVFDGTNVTSLTIYQNMGVYAAFTSVTLSSGSFSLNIPHNLGYFPSKIQFYGSQASDFTQPLDLLGIGDMTTSTLQRSVIAQTSDLAVLVKNPTNGIFYKDFSGTAQTSGFRYVVAER